MRVWQTTLDQLANAEAVALVMVDTTFGSTPREAGAALVVRPDGAFSGTIGGGTLEWAALAAARRLLAAGSDVATLDKVLGPDLGQCCGGRARLRIERLTRADRGWIAPLARAEAHGQISTHALPDSRGIRVRRLAEGGDPATDAIVETFGIAATPLLLFGAGHVGRSLALALAPLPFAVVWVDGRPDAFPTHVPTNVTCVALAEPGPVLERAASGTFVAVMTHSHALDYAIVAAALPAQRFPYVGLIGSRTKRARFSRRLRDDGLAPDVVGRLVCPIGLPGINDKQPAVIAAGIAAQLLLARSAQAQHADRPQAMQSHA